MQDETLPTIDLVALSHPDPARRSAEVDALRRAGLRHGFFYLTGHGVPEHRLSAVLEQARALFALSEADKRDIAGRGRSGARGYARMGGRMQDGAVQGARKEEYYLGRESVADPNHWPGGLPEFRATMLAHVAAMERVSAQLMTGFAVSLDLPEDHFAAFCTNPIAALRLVHYSAQAEGAGPHSDFGSLTLLLQDDVGGLEVHDRDTDRWIAVAPLPGMLVINIGDLFERWTNGRYRSSVHRVANQGAHRGARDRYSAPYFLTGAGEQEVACIPSCLKEGEAPLYPPVTVAEHLRARFAAQGF